MTEPILKQLTNEDLLWKLDEAIEKNNTKKQETIKKELNRRKQVEL